MKIFAIALVLFFVNSCGNFLRDLPNKSDDDYFVDQAEIYYNQYKFDKAIEKITPILAKNPKNRRVAQIAFMSYAGRAGLRVLDLLLSFADGGNFFAVFAEHFPGATQQDIDDIAMALSILENFQADPTQRDADLNMTAMFFYYAQLGVNLNFYAYNSANVLTPGFDACDVNDLPEEGLTLILQSVPRAIDAASNIADGGAALDILDDLNNSPVFADLLEAQNTICPGQVAQDVLACETMRAVINEGDAGVGLGSGVVIPCP